MFSEVIQPRFNETDALGHINNTVLASWFEFARNPVFKLFNPTLSIGDWNLILRHTEYSFERELFVGAPVEIKTSVSEVGRTSCTVYQEAWQKNRLCVSGTAVLVQYDYQAKTPTPINDAVRAALLAHAKPESE